MADKSALPSCGLTEHLPSTAANRSPRSHQAGLPAEARFDPASEGWSGRRGSNPRPTAWKAVTLPLSYSRVSPQPCSQPYQLRPPSPPGFGATAFAGLPSRSPRKRAKAGGEGRVRTSVARRRQVYSLLRLTALPPPRFDALSFGSHPSATSSLRLKADG
jgi:hypothetical protein